MKPATDPLEYQVSAWESVLDPFGAYLLTRSASSLTKMLAGVRKSKLSILVHASRTFNGEEFTMRLDGPFAAVAESSRIDKAQMRADCSYYEALLHDVGGKFVWQFEDLGSELVKMSVDYP